MNVLDFEKRRRVSADLNMTPLIDTVFLLLIFFILSSHFISEKGFKIKLPKAAHAQQQKDGNITIFVRSEKEIFIDNDLVVIDEMEEKLRPRIAKSDSGNVLIKADEKTDLKLAVRIMDIAKAAGASGLVISTQVFDNENK